MKITLTIDIDTDNDIDREELIEKFISFRNEVLIDHDSKTGKMGKGVINIEEP